MKINKFVKKKDGMYNVELEDGSKLLIHEDLILKYDLLLKRELDDKDYKLISDENMSYSAYNKAIKYIGIRMRSIFELRSYLKKYVDNENIINQVVDKLLSQGYLNDEMFARSYVNDRIALSTDGPYKIHNSLKEHRISEKDIEDALAAYTEDIQIEKIKKYIEKSIKSNTNKGYMLLKQKILANLINMGYNRHTVLDELSNYNPDDEDIYKKEYEKIYNKLSKKYSGYELDQRIKQKLYQKGFYWGSY